MKQLLLVKVEVEVEKDWGCYMLASTYLCANLFFYPVEKDFKMVKSAFPMSHINAERFLDPHNTVSAYEYYLLENLSVGLLRDNQKQLNDPY